MAEVEASNPKIRRLQRGMTLDDLAAACAAAGAPVHAAQLSRIERGLYIPRPRLRAVLARQLGLDVTDFETAATTPEGGAA